MDQKIIQREKCKVPFNWGYTLRKNDSKVKLTPINTTYNQSFQDCITGKSKLEIETDISKYNGSEYVFFKTNKEQ